MDVDGIYIVKGDITCDQKITIDDLIATQSYLLGIKTLSGDSLVAGDTNNNGSINLVDLTNINMHRLGVRMITEVVNK